jgi:hypothetical protein
METLSWTSPNSLVQSFEQGLLGLGNGWRSGDERGDGGTSLLGGSSQDDAFGYTFDGVFFAV